MDSGSTPMRPDGAAERPTPGRRAAAWFADRLIRRDLVRTFRRLVWVGPRPWAEGTLDARRPLVLYTNHHSFHDGYVLWWLAHYELHRQPILWMNDWTRIPLFGPLGALPFPTGDAAQRRATIRETARRMAEPGRVFLYFPEGELRPSDSGLGDFNAGAFARLARLFPDDTQWWPVGMRVTWWGEDRPTVLLTGGAPHNAPDGTERARLQALIAELRAVPPGTGRTLLDGTRSAHERWDLSAFAPLFRRWT